jgi:hypothetical protein
MVPGSATDFTDYTDAHGLSDNWILYDADSAMNSKTQTPSRQSLVTSQSPAHPTLLPYVTKLTGDRRRSHII